MPRCPSRPGGTLGTGGPDRAGTAAAGEQLPGRTEGREEEQGEEGGVRAVQVAGERLD